MGQHIFGYALNAGVARETFTCSSSTMKTRKRCEICLKLTVKTPELRHGGLDVIGLFIVYFEHISHLFSTVFIIVLEQVSVCSAIA